jgi:hypothetical protein
MNAVITQLWYNPTNYAFEGRIDITRGGQPFRYPCAVKGPENMLISDVHSRMYDQAMRMSDTPSAVFDMQ